LTFGVGVPEVAADVEVVAVAVGICRPREEPTHLEP